jgi:hypothetical protein
MSNTLGSEHVISPPAKSPAAYGLQHLPCELQLSLFVFASKFPFLLASRVSSSPTLKQKVTWEFVRDDKYQRGQDAPAPVAANRYRIA